MSMSSNSVGYDRISSVPVHALVYHDIAGAASSVANGGSDGACGGEGRTEAAREDPGLSREEFARRMEREKAEVVRVTEERLRREYERKLGEECLPVAAAVASFAVERDHYFERAEAEIVQLALAIAAKILHREAQVDPMLVATLVRIAVEKMRDGTSVTLRVGRGQGGRWTKYFEQQLKHLKVEVVEDETLSDLDCQVETELGAANFGLDTQLKEVEQGFFDLMALRPAKG